MEWKTHEVAKELGMAPRTIRKWVKKYKIPCHKNDYGHYVYDAEAFSHLETLKASLEAAGTLDVYEESLQYKVNVQKAPVKETVSKPLQHRIESLLERMNRTERMIDQKADEVVSYQLLQQRKEIEELNKKVDMLEMIVEELQSKQLKKFDPPLIFDQPLQPKRRGVFRSIFGL
jgi:chromosome-anchoring protein RacA